MFRLWGMLEQARQAKISDSLGHRTAPRLSQNTAELSRASQNTAGLSRASHNTAGLRRASHNTAGLSRANQNTAGLSRESQNTSGTRRVTLVISHIWWKDREVFTTSGTYQWSFVTQMFRNGQPSHGGDRNSFEVMTSTKLIETVGSISSFSIATRYQGNQERNNKLWNTGSTERCILHMQALLKYCYK